MVADPNCWRQKRRSAGRSPSPAATAGSPGSHRTHYEYFGDLVAWSRPTPRQTFRRTSARFVQSVADDLLRILLPLGTARHRAFKPEHGRAPLRRHHHPLRHQSSGFSQVNRGQCARWRLKRRFVVHTALNSGQTIVFDGKPVVLNGGDFTLLDTSRGCTPSRWNLPRPSHSPSPKSRRDGTFPTSTIWSDRCSPARTVSARPPSPFCVPPRSSTTVSRRERGQADDQNGARRAGHHGRGVAWVLAGLAAGNARYEPPRLAATSTSISLIRACRWQALQRPWTSRTLPPHDLCARRRKSARLHSPRSTGRLQRAVAGVPPRAIEASARSPTAGASTTSATSAGCSAPLTGYRRGTIESRGFRASDNSFVRMKTTGS